MFIAEDICQKLRENGKKVTPQRRLIYKALEGKTTHPTAEDIYNDVRAVIPDISLATVYKTLRELVESRFLLEIQVDGDSSRFDPRTDPHSHLKCIGFKVGTNGEYLPCGRLEDISTTYPTLHVSPEELHGYKLIGNEVMFLGYCPACQNS
ncbi:MAG: transcriptional repressor [Chloroflexi bacterium]|uniref:Transcriptional repressor n=1 Tax=Candidatus Chlorohelix allophototropha TaxID=3003348 RepID=A0A8T7M8Z2_9CHLR|nr:transcriptional repressor [Chloroflexota bacterium]WJW68429.1 transcriptional repressor [Chloroflexota bacterium L227-S17]